MNGQREGRSRTALIIALALLTAVPGSERGGTAAPAACPGPERRAVGCRDVLYMIMIDRFQNGDPSNDADVVRGDPRAFHGGDLAGVLQRLDYLQALGVSAVWISPVYPNPPRGYHGYWPLELRGVDGRFGTLETLRKVVASAHARGIKVLLDVIVNHTAPEHPWRRDPERRDWYHNRGDIRNWGDATEVEQGDLFGLPDLNTEHPEVAAYLLETAGWWLREAGVDGFRLDTVKHVPRAFWTGFSRAARAARPDAFLVGEVFDANPRVLAGYLDTGLDALLDFPLQAAITQTFAQHQGLFPVRSALAMRERAFADPRQLGVMVDNHDLPRFLYQAGFDRNPDRALARLRAALTFALTVPGLPVVYYGTETGMTGGPDPYNRGDMRFDDQPALRAWTAALVRMRRDEPALWGRALDLVPLAGAERLLAYVRTPDEPGDRPVLVVIQASDEPQAAVSFALPAGVGARNLRARLLFTTRDGPAGRSASDGGRGAARVRLETGRAIVELPGLGPWEGRVYRLEPGGLLAAGPSGRSAAVAGLLVGAVLALAWRSRRARRSGGRP